MDRLSIIQTPEMGRRIFAIKFVTHASLSLFIYVLITLFQQEQDAICITPSGGCNGIRQEQAEQSKSFGLYSI